MTLNLVGPHALVTGGASGIGLAIVNGLAEAGARVIIGDIDETAGNAVASQLTDGMFRHLDVTDIGAIRSLADFATRTWGSLDILVNCAGGSLPRPFFETDEEQWRKVIDLNLYGAMRCSHAFGPAMAAKRAGRIINISSGAGLHGQIGQAAYSAAKGGVNAFTKVLARELAFSNVTANAVCPGATETPPMRKFIETAEGRAFTARIAATIPMGRFAQPEDIASIVVFLASKGAGYITGELISVSGGVGM